MGKGGGWYLNLYRGRYDGRPDDADDAGGGGGDDTPAGPAISRAEAESRVRDLLARMGAPRASWKVDTTDTEIGTGWACADPSPAMTPEELKKLEAEKLRQVEQQNASGGSTGAMPAGKPGPDGVPSCALPPAPAKGFNVALYPVVDGRRADWPVWNVTMRSDGRIESLSGSWVMFERGDDYKLRGVDAALKDLQSPPDAYATDTPAVGLPVDAPACPPVAMPLPARDDTVTSSMAVLCTPRAQVVKITGVAVGLIQTSVFENGQVRLALVPSYRFVGHFDNGTPWETSVIALHPDAIARDSSR